MKYLKTFENHKEVDYTSSTYEVPTYVSDEDTKKILNIIKHLKSTVSHVQHDKYVNRIEKILDESTPKKSDGSKMCMKDSNGNTVGR